jgi:type IV pilus assembly protein PilY1
MKLPRYLKLSRITFGLALIASLLMQPVSASETKLADLPLANATTVSILPNIYFILDDSGSMGWDYMPDYVTNSYCRGIGSNLVSCEPGDPPYYASDFNRVYYNPMINYTPPINADGSSKTSYTTWTSVPNDGYGIQSPGTINLTTKYPERVACKHTYDDTNGTNCKSQIDGATYKYPDTTYFNILIKEGAPFYYKATVEWCSSRDASPRFGTAGTCQVKKDSAHPYVRYSGWTRVDIIPSRTSYPGPNSTTRTYAQEMTNFANWYAWYRTRMQMTKTGVGQAFSKIRGTPVSDLDDPTDKTFFHARIGYSTISNTGTTEGSEFLNIRNFDSSQKTSWFTKLYGAVPGGGTPLMGALAKAGRIYAGKIGVDPIQYSCQRNFTMLSTDGYWNSVTATYGPTKEDGTTLVGDQDKAAPPPSYDKLAKANTLADLAYYYYHTDLRPGSCGVCTNNVPPSGTNQDEDDVATHQHMTTFTIGLGVDGSLAYQDGYKTSTTGDYRNLKKGTVWWPDPTDTEDLDRIDDLWHAAVNGRGTYLSAKNPESLINGLNDALGAIAAANGSGAAAATSNLEPVLGDNAFFVASYKTVSWDGELSAKTIDPDTGNVSLTTTWNAAGLLDSKIASNGLSDTRTIYTSNATSLISFEYSNLSATQKAYFNNNQLSQYSDWAASQVTDGTQENLLKYIRGQNRYEDQDRDVAYGTYSRLYRDRATTLGDIVHAQPVYVQAPPYSFADSGYDTFKASQASRAPTVYVSANDGMLHAFNATTGEERWAYLPPIVMPNLWRLADKDYTTNHRYFVDGPLTIADINDGGTWKTILIGALGKGGRGYFALDITNPTSPKYMWSFTADTNANMGYSYGGATVTKVDETWVVLLPSGYNNIPEGGKYTSADGIGRLFMLNAASGSLIKQISTGTGSVSTPSGLAKINPRVQFFETNNTATLAYGGDLLGNLWRFDLLNGTASKIIALGSNQPITVAPEIADANGKTVLYFGTGRYLAQDDLALDKQQAIYGVKDNGTSEVLSNTLVEQTITSNIISSNPVDWNVNGGWFINLPDDKERIALEAKLVMGTLMVASIVPEASECEPGGRGNLYFIDYFNGGSVDGEQSVFSYPSPIVGMSAILTKEGVKVVPVTADGKIGSPRKVPKRTSGGGGSESGRRLMWRELVE